MTEQPMLVIKKELEKQSPLTYHQIKLRTGLNGRLFGSAVANGLNHGYFYKLSPRTLGNIQ